MNESPSGFAVGAEIPAETEVNSCEKDIEAVGSQVLCAVANDAGIGRKEADEPW